MIERYGAWWHAVLAGAMLATASLGGCTGTVVHAPSDAAVSDIVVIDTAPAVDAPVVDTPLTVDVPVVDAPPIIDTPPAVDTPSVTCDAGTIPCGATCVDTATPSALAASVSPAASADGLVR